MAVSGSPIPPENSLHHLLRLLLRCVCLLLHRPSTEKCSCGNHGIRRDVVVIAASAAVFRILVAGGKMSQSSEVSSALRELTRSSGTKLSGGFSGIGAEASMVRADQDVRGRYCRIQVLRSTSLQVTGNADVAAVAVQRCDQTHFIVFHREPVAVNCLMEFHRHRSQVECDRR